MGNIESTYKDIFLHKLSWDPYSYEFQNVEEYIDKWNESCCFWHAHVYFTDEVQREHALWIRQQMVDRVTKGILSCDVGPLLDAPGNGPHTWPYFEIQFETLDHTKIVTFLQFHHMTNPVPIHPISVYHGLNHTTRALWLGEKQPVKTEFLANFDALILKEISGVKDDRKTLVHLMYTHMVPARYGVHAQDVYSKE